MINFIKKLYIKLFDSDIKKAVCNFKKEIEELQTKLQNTAAEKYTDAK